MAGIQLNNIMLLDTTEGIPRTIETGGTPDIIQFGVDVELVSGANMVIDGDLTVNGTTTSINTEHVNVEDNYLYLNANYTADPAQTGGIVINVDPTTTSDTVAAGGFTAGVAATSNPTVVTAGTASFSVGDIIQISGAADPSNNGIFEVLSDGGTTITIRGVGVTGTVEDFTQNQFVTDTTAQGTITHINVAVLRSNGSGVFQTAFGNSTPFTFTNVGVGNVTLQDAYEAGNTITTSAGEGNVTITGTEDFIISLSDLLVDTTAGISLDADAASNFTVDSGSLTLSTTTSGAVDVSSAAEVDIDATTTVTVDTADAADASGNDITLTAGTSTSGTNGGASIILTPGDGNTTGVAGDVTISSPADEDESLLTITSTGTNGNSVSFFTGTSNPDTVVTADAGSLFLRDTGSGSIAYLNTSTGSGSTWTAFATGGTVTLQEAYDNGNTITTSAGEGDLIFTGTEDLVVTLSDMLVDTTASISLDADAASNFTVDGAALTLSTTTSGNVNVSSAAAVDIDATTTVTVDTADATDASGNDITITAGSSTGGTNDGASIILTPGDGDTTGAAGDVTITSPADEDESLLTIASTGTNGNSVSFFTGTSDPSGSITADAGSLFLRDTGSGAEIYLNTSTGSGTTWASIDPGAATLQSAYVGGNTITTSAGEGDVTFTGTEDFVITLSDLLVDTTASISLDADAASNFTVDGAALTLSTTTSGNVDVTAADAVNITAGNEAAATGNAVTVTAGDGGGTNAGGTVDLVGGAGGTGAGGNGGNVTATAGAAGTGSAGTGGSVVLTTGAGDGAGSAGFVDITGPNDEDEAILQLTTTGTNGDSVQMFVGDSDPSGSVTALAGSLFFRDTGTGAALYLNTSTGSGTTWSNLATGGAVTLQNAYEGGNTITTSGGEGDITFGGTEDFLVTLSDMDVDTTGSITLNADAVSNFTVDTTGAAQDLTISVAGATDSSLILSSSGTGGDALQISAPSGGIDITVAASDTDALEVSDGSNEYININSADVTVDINQFVDIVGDGIGVRITTDDALVAGDVVTVAPTSGNVEQADANTGTFRDGIVSGVSTGTFSAAGTARIYTVHGSLVPVRFSSPPAAASNGSIVFLSTTAGVATLTPPVASGNVIFQVGILQGADGATSTPEVFFHPRFIARIP